jgi:L-Ala-D/L-Glu epimerase
MKPIKITHFTLSSIQIDLKTPFKTALREVSQVDDVVLHIHTDSEHIGIGSAPPTVAITGEDKSDISNYITQVLEPLYLNKPLDDPETLLRLLDTLDGHTSAKAAVDMALYDLFAKIKNVPLYTYLNGTQTKLKSNITISLNDVATMVHDAKLAVKEGYTLLKVKVGGSVLDDIERVFKIRSAIGRDITLRIDANQAWDLESAKAICEGIAPFNIELIEQPLKANEIVNMAILQASTPIALLADESVFSLDDAKNVIAKKAANFINIKLMKCGGIYQAIKIAKYAKAHNINCMIGCMIESPISIAAAAHFAMSQSNVTMYDLDAPLLCKSHPVIESLQIKNDTIALNSTPGLGVSLSVY